MCRYENFRCKELNQNGIDNEQIEFDEVTLIRDADFRALKLLHPEWPVRFYLDSECRFNTPKGWYKAITTPDGETFFSPAVTLIECTSPEDRVANANNPITKVLIDDNNVALASVAFSDGKLYYHIIPEYRARRTRANQSVADYAEFLCNTIVRREIELLTQTATEGKGEIDALLEQEHQNTEDLETAPLYYAVPTRDDLFNTEPEHYDAATHLCVAFRRKEDLWKDLQVPFGNMIGGFAFKMNGVIFPSSEQAYIAGLFSHNTPEHIELQKALLNEASGYMAKRNTRAKNVDQWREDWETFNIDWMLYCVWNKVQGNEDFKKLLMAVPRNAMLIEDVTFQLQPKNARDTTTVWGCRNQAKKEFGQLVRRHVSSLGFPTEKAAKDAVNNYLWDYCNVGEYVGQNIMGKILTIVKNCLHEGTEPDIDYDLLNRKKIYLFGEKVEFPSKA